MVKAVLAARATEIGLRTAQTTSIVGLRTASTKV
jgi:hypothetical protein